MPLNCPYWAFIFTKITEENQPRHYDLLYDIAEVTGGDRAAPRALRSALLSTAAPRPRSFSIQTKNSEI